MNDRDKRAYVLLSLWKRFDELYRECTEELSEVLRDVNCYDYQRILTLWELINRYDEKMNDIKHQLESLVETY